MSARRRTSGSPKRRRGGQVPFGIIGFAVLIGVAAGLVITDRANLPGVAGVSAAPASTPASAPIAELTGHARVIDGDTFDLAGERIRLWGVDAPERDQVCEGAAGDPYMCGQDATRALAERTAGAPVACAPQDFDRYGRTIARCQAGGEDLGASMVRAGHALDYTRYSRGAYLGDELKARRAKVGVWQGRFTRPENWRRGG